MKFLKKLDIELKDEQLILTALTHSSYSNEHNCENYERLEYLGDAVLQIIISEYFYKNTTLNEGDMSKTRASYVCENALAEYSKKMEIKPYIRVGVGQLKDINETIMADIFESVLGAIYLSNGIEEAKKIVNKIVIPYIESNYLFMKDYKSLVQEYVQTGKKSLEYIIDEETGPAHDKTFKVSIHIDNKVFGRGEGKSKKEAEQNAALDAYQKISK